MKDNPVMTDEMDELYQAGEKPGDGEGKSVDQQEQEEMSKSATVPVAVLMGHHKDPLKVGDEVVVKVKSLNGEDAEIVYSETKPSEIGGEGNEQNTREAGDKEIDEMNEAGGGAY